MSNTPLSPTMQENFRGFTFVDESSMQNHFAHRDSPGEDEMNVDEEAAPGSDDDDMDDIQNNDMDDEVLGRFE
ncbi:protein of unknown function [Taphrina deformans PYCC 5710]|uniref:Uncharacterized protein n=1 Tax=Taphrina deformans (strain PYCC 5710 / ATCC 11124 / CBS 356.35 / IMI 108563 / JCM 9778 / NBRC 8474) TaxID=1097556 RepID=R4X6U5_TAPDE|nr:protein of unknown function [Taphrina deformans PYCC 5710]|eukprot:CCG80936.1 protein of unknown function [Taphrina deformans PYCC 5710]